MKKLSCLATLVLAAVALPAAAQEKNNAISFAGNITSQDGSTSGFSYMSYGRLMGNFELDFLASVSFSSGSGSGTDTMTMGGVGAKYYFAPVGKAGASSFFMRAEILGSSGSGNNSAYYGGYVGLEHALTEQAAVYVEGGAAAASGSGSKTQGKLNFGLTYRF